MALVLLGVANVAAIVALWLSGGGLGDLGDGASALTGLGRLCGLLGAYGVLERLSPARRRATWVVESRVALKTTTARVPILVPI